MIIVVDLMRDRRRCSQFFDWSDRSRVLRRDVQTHTAHTHNLGILLWRKSGSSKGEREYAEERELRKKEGECKCRVE